MTDQPYDGLTGAEAQATERELERQDAATRSTSAGLDADEDAAGNGEDSVAARAARVGTPTRLNDQEATERGLAPPT